MADQERKPGGGNMVTRKYGPLPGYAWVGVSAGVVFLYLRHRASSQAAAAGADTSGSSAGAPVDNGSPSSDYAPGAGLTGDYPSPAQDVDTLLERISGQLNIINRNLYAIRHPPPVRHPKPVHHPTRRRPVRRPGLVTRLPAHPAVVKNGGPAVT